MHEVFRQLIEGDIVLDLGSAAGSFPAAQCPGVVVRADADPLGGASGGFIVRCRAEALPFRSGVFRAVIANHSLEHFERLDEALCEVRRTVKHPGYFYAAVPDASTLSDGLYRWLGRGGGHINRFTDPEALEQRIALITALRAVGRRTLHTSYSFLNRRAMRSRPPLRLILLGGGREGWVRGWSYLFRLLDRVLGTRLSVYGWALYFGEEPGVETKAWTNVCVRCGSAEAAASIEKQGKVRRGRLGVRQYRCGGCGALNYFTRDPR